MNRAGRQSVKARPAARSAKDVGAGQGARKAGPKEAKESAPPRRRWWPPSAPAPAPAKLKSSAVVVAFGPYKGKTASELSDEELSETIDLAHEKLMEQPKAKWARAMRENLAALEAETELRCRVPAATAQRRPDSAVPGSERSPAWRHPREGVLLRAQRDLNPQPLASKADALSS